MDTIQAVIMGFVQGLSEFLPISSSAHIVFASAIYKIFVGKSLTVGVNGEEIFFDIIIHLATLLAIFVYFYKDLLEISKGFLKACKEKKYQEPDFLFVKNIAIATIFTCVLALFFKDIAHKLVENPFIVSILLLGTGFILYFSEKFKQDTKNMTLKTAILIGIAQGLAVFPGLSRSGLTIATGVFNGIKRIDAAKFSFILSIPIILGASMVYPLLELDFAEIKTFNFSAIIFGFITSFVVGYICIKYFMKFLAKSSLKGFAYYCWIIGILMMFIFKIFG